MWLLKLIVFSLLLFFVKCVPVSESNLHLVHVFFRHGDRTPDKKDFYPTDPYKNYSFFPMGLGQLTNAGKYREYNLGQMLRKRYNDFLGDIYNPEILSASSSDYDRTKMSLMLVLTGLWPPSLIQQWNPELLWQPIPYNYKPASQDHLIQRPSHYCPRYIEELNKVILSTEVQKYIKENWNVFQFVQKWAGKEMNIPINMFDVYQNLNSEATLNLTLPEWTKEVYPEPLHSIAGMQLKFENSNDLLIRLNGGHSLKMVLDNTKKKIKHDKEMHEKRIILISGHENNVVNVLTTLDQFYPHVPKYGSAVIFELHHILGKNQFAYKVLYYDQISKEPKLVKLNGCDELCPLDRFIALTSKYIPGNYTMECQSDVNLD